ncbi:hypothetical protein ETAA8_30770 [Anatilimnocola aggregata]|uniref:Uncharacterized protein n=1 Tax=Anatilimnocola aggregata TaxID=2528021 RepID=A0A517YCL9_9BACT|nr:hypothetical protein [Anatilimnocola aggregata]QDU27985.1 hypothetical protein ETAA8_30770 [Anatilimnocola aggregata]
MADVQLGSITLSIDLELEISRASKTQLRWLDDLTPELVALLDSHAIPATWAVADPARSAATEPVLASTQPHELAVLGDRSWLGWGAGGSRANRELARRINGAAARQITIRTLVLHNESSFANGLPLAELGIRAIRQPIGHEVVRAVSMAGLPHDLQLAEQVQRVTLPTWWSWWDWQSQLATQFRRTSLFPGHVACHLGIDAQQLCDAGPRGLHRLDQLLGQLNHLRERQGLAIQTLRQWSDRRGTPSRRVA